MNGIKLESVQCVKDLGVKIVSSLKFFQQCKDVTGDANRMLGFMKRNFSIKKIKKKKMYFCHCIST